MPVQLTPAGDAAVADIGRRYRLSDGAVRSMMDAVARGGGSMAQFSIPELGGSGQWMRGGMTMVGDMFNSGLQATVSNLCLELSTLLAAGDAMVQPMPGPAGGQPPGMRPFGGAWWPADLGTPSSTGGQNDSSYAYFPTTRRLAIKGAGRVTVYDTGDHSISGVQQQQGGYGTVQFTSQYGTFTVDTLQAVNEEGPHAGAAPVAVAADPPRPVQLPPVQPPPVQPPPVQPPPVQPMSAAEIGGAIETLAGLRDKGILTDEEFTTKKTELLARL